MEYLTDFSHWGGFGVIAIYLVIGLWKILTIILSLDDLEKEVSEDDNDKR